MKFELMATTAFGLEAVVRREIESLGYKVIKTEDGKVTYVGDERAIVRSNLWLRTADRIYLRMGEFKATTFEELFQQTKGIEWEKIIPIDGSFPVVGTSVKSVLHSVPACQSIIKKAIVSRLASFYMKSIFDENGSEYRVRFQALKDRFTILVDTSGVGLHKRGYRVEDVAAPMKETLAAALVQLSFYRADKQLVDTCCGSGTIPIEAAMIERNIAPGLGRDFASSKWEIIQESIWKEERAKAYGMADYGKELDMKGFDISRKAVNASIANAEEAGVLDDIKFFKKDMLRFEPDTEYGVVISNLPYGIRIGTDEELDRIYQKFRELMDNHPTWSFFLITSDKELEKKLDRKADRRRKLYNGTIETQFYQYHGVKPARKREE